MNANENLNSLVRNLLKSRFGIFLHDIWNVNKILSVCFVEIVFALNARVPRANSDFFPIMMK